ncbi:disulfide bond formation protein DsbA [Achromobacter pulmonis]|uniref:Disulfide bond formation protein DsbA n=1 Tax=Achromobacter pulmonis TaxID=1389932 RepID=A0A2N8K8L5_9BURK|nr:thioredoxin domain-containing protein [Achromobacter pulmonis]MBO9333215.1 thioredoxin domain-containing protein [Achromobacter xylosoxidans]PND29784.1 disulfide bond formation protein DsbA [Achromobacter pulmonis]
MRLAPRARPLRRYLLWLGLAFGALALLLGGWLISRTDTPRTADSPLARLAVPAGPPWDYGAANPRFTLVLYADLECPYCKAYVPQVMAWVDRHPETRLRWHHLPLPTHEPTATRLASLAECVGKSGGQGAFWQAVAWIYQHTRSDGLGLPDGTRYPGLTPALQACLDDEHATAVDQAQARDGARAGIAATPTVRVRDESTGQSLLLPGPVEDDALLSALDLLAAGAQPSAAAQPPELSAIPDGDMPR